MRLNYLLALLALLLLTSCGNLRDSVVGGNDLTDVTVRMAVTGLPECQGDPAADALFAWINSIDNQTIAVPKTPSGRPDLLALAVTLTAAANALQEPTCCIRLRADIRFQELPIASFPIPVGPCAGSP